MAKTKAIVVAAALALTLPLDAQAYLDLGTGSAVIQIVIATVAGALLSLKIYWRRLHDLVLRRPSRPARLNAAAKDRR